MAKSKEVPIKIIEETGTDKSVSAAGVILTGRRRMRCSVLMTFKRPGLTVDQSFSHEEAIALRDAFTQVVEFIA